MITPREFALARHFATLPPTYRYHEKSESTGYYPSFYYHTSAFDCYKSAELYQQPITEVALDLSLKPTTPITPPSTPSPSSPTHTKKKEHPDGEGTPDRKSGKVPAKRHKVARKLNFDEEKTSPVSGTIIRELRDDEPPLVVRKGDIDPAFNLVEVTEEAKAELAKIDNKIGDYICRLCKEMYEDAFALAQHRCSRIVHVEYRCPECDKVFNCPANLASHRRWHKPRALASATKSACNAMDLAKKSHQEDESGSDAEAPFACHVCHKRFRRQAYLRKHVMTHQSSADRNFEFPLLQTGN